MMTDYITLAGFILAVFGTGVAVGRIVEQEIGVVTRELGYESIQ